MNYAELINQKIDVKIFIVANDAPRVILVRPLSKAFIKEQMIDDLIDTKGHMTKRLKRTVTEILEDKIESIGNLSIILKEE